MAYTAEQLSGMLFDALQKNPSMSYDQVVKDATTLGVDLAGVEQAYKDVGNQAFQNQFGRDAVGQEGADALYYLTHVAGLDEGQTKLNNTQEGYNYDTNDLVAAYRETFGRNPNQEEYVGAMATLGVDNFDRASLGDSGNYTAATVAALESDPYAGRYAGFNPYDLPTDAANVSTNILGDQVQYTSPITQRPVVANFTDGDLELSAGLDVLTPAQIQSAIGLATATGGLTAEDRTTMMDSVRSAKSMDDLYAAFSTPQAVAALGANGVQVGVGKTEAEARANGFNGLDGAGLTNVYNTLFKDAKPYTTAQTVGAGKTITPENIRTTINNSIASTQLGAQKGLDALSASTLPTFTNFGTFGAAGNEKLGAGSADYQSELIESLRTADDSLKSTNSGVNKWGFFGTGADAQPFGAPSPDASAFNPSVFTPTTASPTDVSDWNSYSSYRTNALTDKTPIVTFDEWLAGGKSNGKAVVNTAAAATTNNDSVY